MPFSQELKIEAYVRGFKCTEIEIGYRVRAGEVKLNTIRDGLGNIKQLIMKRLEFGLKLPKLQEETITETGDMLDLGVETK